MAGTFSLDVATLTTGWCYTEDGCEFTYGTIKIKSKYEKTERLLIFHEELSTLLNEIKPTNIVLEDTFAKMNIKTLKALSEFAGVAKFTCKKVANIDPYVISNKTVKAFFNAKDKEILFAFILEILEEKGLTFEKDNDIIDSIAQLMCYTQDILNLYTFRAERTYGYEFFNKNYGGY